jgi:hypothetical protein
VLGPSPCAGVYGTVRAGGAVKRGDDVIVASPADYEGSEVNDPDTQPAMQTTEADLERNMSRLGAG